MELLGSTMTTTAVAAIYVIYSRYRDYVVTQCKMDRQQLRERVTYMLWCAAEQM